ncbi:MAG TPA: hypothetical protein DCG48_04160 [Rhodospirillaceae bacterium]|nr:hypothetical protein [Rhodospirillaceae bacterium]
MRRSVRLGGCMAPDMTDEEIAAALARVETCLGEERPLDAVRDLQGILAVRPNHPMALCGVGRVGIQVGDSTAALEALDLAVRQAPDLLEARNARGVALQNLGRLDEAETEFQTVVEAVPDNPGALLNLASLLAAKGDYSGAEPVFAKILDLNPDDPTAGYNLGLLKLVLGDFQAGWRRFDLRHRASNVGLAAVTSPQPRWTGECRPDATLLITAEQGLGDNIQFVRYATAAAARVGRVILEAPSPLIDLFRDLTGPAEIVARGAPLPDHDLYIPIMSLPGVFETRADTIPWDGPYLHAPEDRLTHWRRRLDTSDGRWHVGLVWAGNPDHKRDRDRSMNLADLAPLTETDGVQFHALQIGPPADQLASVAVKRPIRRVFHTQRSLPDVAAAIGSLDLLIGVDTALVHLAGAMGMPVWTMISKVPDWRWMLDRADTPWYPSMRLFRQKQTGDWGPVIEDVNAALADFTKSKKVRSESGST